MRRTMMKAKIHRVRVTAAELAYEGSLTVDRDLMEAAHLLPYEKVQVVDIDNGQRLETYVIEGEAGSGAICLNGGAARLGQVGDTLIVISYGEFEDSELANFKPIVVHVDADNRPRPQLQTMEA